MADAGVTLVGSMTHEKTAKPGEKIEGQLMLKNRDEDRSADVRIYQTNYFLTADKGESYEKSANQLRSNEKWVALSQNYITVPPKALITVPYTVHVPADANLNGTYWSLIMVEPVDESSRPKGKGFGLMFKIRYAVQLITHVGTSATYDLKVVKNTVTENEEKKVFEFDLMNEGTRAVGPKVTMDVYGKDGKPAGHFEGERRRLYPGCSMRYVFNIASLDKGSYRALILADPDDDNVLAVEYELAIKTPPLVVKNTKKIVPLKRTKS